MTTLARRNKTKAIKDSIRHWGPTKLWKTTYRGNDYSMGRANRNKDGIHFGCIGVNDCDSWIWDDFESDYGEPFCPVCGNEAEPFEDTDPEITDKYENYQHSCADFVCNECELVLGSDCVYSDEALCHYLDDGEYKAWIDDHNDVIIEKSPYYTYAQFASPCFPGGGHLNHPCKNGVKTLCLGHSFFENDVAPYVVFDVKTNKIVRPQQ